MTDRLDPEQIESIDNISENERPAEPGADAQETAGELKLPEDVWAEDEADASPIEENESAETEEAAYAPPEPPVEMFVPTQYFQSQEPKKGAARKRRRRRARNRKRRAILAIAIGVLLILLAIGSSYALRLFRDPGSFFAPETGATATPAQGGVLFGQATPTPSPTPTASPTIDPYTALEQQADLSLMQNIVNVLVIGVDYAEERETWSGKHEYHADVMMVLAINFDENRVDLISIPRDTYAKIPGVDGIYKINASINCGGGFEAPDGGGFLKTCEAASWMLGGIPVDYYYAVTMPAVKQLVNAFGGVDYELELSFTMAGRSYSKGQQHMNGQAVLDYLRVRKNVTQSGDLNRINRQKKMMVALFQQMQKKNLLLKIPEILSSFSGQLFTNCTMEQTAALALFAYNLSSEHIGMYSMGGKMTEGIFGWNFVLTDQGNRVEIIQDVYGIEVPRLNEYSAAYAHYRWQSLIMDQYIKTTKSMHSEVKNYIASGELIPDPTIEPTVSPTPSQSPDATPTAPPAATPTAPPTAAPTAPPTVAPTAPPTEVPTEAPPPDPTATPAEGTGGAPNVADGASMEILPGIRIPIVVKAYTVAQQHVWQDYMVAYDELMEARERADQEAKKCAAGKSNSLSDRVDRLTAENSHYKTAALRLAQEFGYPMSSFNWGLNVIKDNEIEVDFR